MGRSWRISRVSVSRSMMAAAVWESRLPVGSSASSRSGALIRVDQGPRDGDALLLAA